MLRTRASKDMFGVIPSVLILYDVTGQDYVLQKCPFYNKQNYLSLVSSAAWFVADELTGINNRSK